MERTTINWLAILSIGTVHSNRFALSLQTEEKLKKTNFKMKSIIAFAVLIAVAVAAPLESDHTAVVLKSENTNIGVDNWTWL